MIDREKAYVGMPVIRKSDGKQVVIDAIDYHPDALKPYRLDENTRHCWHSGQELDPIDPPAGTHAERPLEVGDTVEVSQESHPDYGCRGKIEQASNSPMPNSYSIRVRFPDNDTGWYDPGQLRRIDPIDPPAEPTMPKRVEVVTEMEMKEVPVGLVIRLTIDESKELMRYHDCIGWVWKNLYGEIKAALASQEART